MIIIFLSYSFQVLLSGSAFLARTLPALALLVKHLMVRNRFVVEKHVGHPNSDLAPANVLHGAIWFHMVPIYFTAVYPSPYLSYLMPRSFPLI